MHYQVAEDHGFITLDKGFAIIDKNGSMILPVEGVNRLKENYVGSHFDDFDGFLMLSHFKRHVMIKNIGLHEGKNLINTAGRSHTILFGGEQNAFLEQWQTQGSRSECFSLLICSCKSGEIDVNRLTVQLRLFYPPPLS